MQYISTRGQVPAVSFSTAVAQGLAPDGGLYLPVSYPSFSVDEIEAMHGGSIIGDLSVHEINATLSARDVESIPIVHQLDYESCLTLGLAEPCDDGARLSSLIAEAPDGYLSIKLISPQYQAETPVLISRSDLEVTGLTDDPTGGEPVDTRAKWVWSPRAGSGQTWPFIIRGAGPEGSAYRVNHDLIAGQRHITVSGALDSLSSPPTWVRLGADDFGDVPPVCVDGRDIERYQRHQRQLFRVLQVMRADDETTTLILDRAININIPLTAQPTLTSVRMLTHVTLSNIKLDADCPEAFDATGFNQARCQNSEVIDDGGVLSHYTDHVTLEQLSTRGFGKFSLELRDTLLNVVRDCDMRDPSAYGSGGQGYGVHLIGASRSLIVRERVTHARHGVVVDFGSSDSQVLDGDFSDMNQALIDVHGEASRDTLIKGNTLSHSSLGVIIGGGGRSVHCNDGPHHHVIDNHITECGIGVSVSDYTERVYVRSNSFEANGGHVSCTFGARQVEIERNRFESAQVSPVSMSFEDTGAVTVSKNLFVDICSVDQAALAAALARAAGEAAGGTSGFIFIFGIS